MMIRKILFATVVSLLASASVQAGEVVRLTRFAGQEITGVSAGGPFDVELVHVAGRAQNRAVVEIEANLEQYLALEIDPAGVVRIGWSGLPRNDRSLSRLLSESRPKLTLYLGTLSKIELLGSGHVLATSGQAFPGGTIHIQTRGSGSVRGLHVSGERLEVNSSGSGSIHVVCRQMGSFSARLSGSGGIDLSAADNTSAEVSVSGSGSVTLSGSAQRAEFGVVGSGRIQAESFRVRQASVRVSGSGGIRLHVEESVEGSVSGSGSVRYAGRPQRIQVSTTGSGSIRAL